MTQSLPFPPPQAPAAAAEILQQLVQRVPGPPKRPPETVVLTGLQKRIQPKLEEASQRQSVSGTVAVCCEYATQPVWAHHSELVPG